MILFDMSWYVSVIHEYLPIPGIQLKAKMTHSVDSSPDPVLGAGSLPVQTRTFK